MAVRSETSRPRSTSRHAAWQALQAHYEVMCDLHLRSLFADVESQPVPDRLRELLEALAAKEKKPE